MKRISSLAVAFLLVLPSLAHAQDEEKKGSSDNGAKVNNNDDNIVTVKTRPLAVDVELSGAFESSETAELRIQPEVWTDLKIDEVVPQGKVVSKGDVVLKLDPRTIDEAIRDLELQIELARLSLGQASKTAEVQEKTSKLDLLAARRSAEQAQEDLEYFLETDREAQLRQAQESVKSSEYRLEYAQEELDQLRQMYEADDLTEETEEIILKRAEREVEQAAYYLDRSRESLQRTEQSRLPREESQLKEAQRRTQLALAKAEIETPASREKAQIDLAKQEIELHRQEQKLERLRRDRKLMELEAPIAGVVFYGRSERGRWPEAQTMAKRLEPGASISSGQVVMTIAATPARRIRVDVPEKNLQHLTESVEAVAVPAAAPDSRLPAGLESLGLVPIKEGTFDAVFHVTDDFTLPNGKARQPLPYPGMSATIRVRVAEEKSALMVPSSAVFKDELDPDQKYVYLAADDGAAEKRTVETGHEEGGQTQILEGLSEGNRIYKTKPEDKADAGS